MRVNHLSLKNIGPFIEADIDFVTDVDSKAPVTLITGENGTGKSIVLDAIRAMFGDSFVRLERDIQRRQRTGEAEISIDLAATDLKIEPQIEPKDKLHLVTTEFSKDGIRAHLVNERRQYQNLIRELPYQMQRGTEVAPNWVVDYWPAVLASGDYQIKSLTRPQHELYLLNSLQGSRQKTDITQLICHYDYMRDSRDPEERVTGEKLYEVLERIIALSLLEGGRLSHVARTTYEPIIIQNGQEVGLSNLSSGNSYLIQYMVGLLSKMHAVHYLRKTPLSELCHTPGLLLIDEAENQLHPKWQKRFLRSVLEIFPNLQIIATTHSPFIISSVPQAQLLVCKAQQDHCVIVDETAQYNNKPVDEILMSPLFEETQPFNEEITELLARRDEAIRADDDVERSKIEERLKQINPEYFGFLDIDSLLSEMTGKGETQ